MIFSSSLALLLSVLTCFATGTALSRLSHDRVRGGRVSPGTKFVQAVTTRSRSSRRPRLRIELPDGRRVEGYLWSVTIEDDPVRRDIALQAPITWSGTGSAEPTGSLALRDLIKGSMIGAVHISYPVLQLAQSPDEPQEEAPQPLDEPQPDGTGQSETQSDATQPH
ncbi:DUF6338 family protein [Actinomadura sp. NPDC023710]|uniref:DUF6338 family protein n=1 Tax=Actinomadura sp. NPDC023710 TaxID=3158219 RepID=UPI00340116B8